MRKKQLYIFQFGYIAVKILYLDFLFSFVSLKLIRTTFFFHKMIKNIANLWKKNPHKMYFSK